MRAENPAQAIQDLLGSHEISRPVVKVCGIKDSQAALDACKAGASLIGLIFASKSKRRIEVNAAREIVETVRSFGERRDQIHVRAGSGSELERFRESALALRVASRRTPLVVGVFQNQDPGEVRSIVDAAGLDIVQFHGAETDIEVDAVGVPAIRVLHMNPMASSDVTGRGQAIVEAARNIKDRCTIAILLDTKVM